MTDPRKTPAGRVLALLDLTSLNPGDDLQSTVDLCRRALTPYGEVAAVCVSPKLVHVARRTLNTLGGRDVRVASVCNFPAGDAPLAEVVEEVRKTLAEGADEQVLLPQIRRAVDALTQINETLPKSEPARFVGPLSFDGMKTLKGRHKSH